MSTTWPARTSQTKSYQTHRRTLLAGVLPLLVAFSVVICTLGSSSATAASSASTRAPAVSLRGLARAQGAIKVSAKSTFCHEAARATKNNTTAAASQTAASIASLYKQLQSEEPVVLAESPAQIRGDFQTLFNFFNKFYGELASVGYNFLKLPATYLASLSSSTASVTAASKAIQAYLTKTCGVSN